MTNFEHMTDAEKKKAIIYGMYHKINGGCGVCPTIFCADCREYPEYTECEKCACVSETEKWLNTEYKAPKTENEKFCETLKIGELIGVSDRQDKLISDCSYGKFIEYNAEADTIITRGSLSPKLPWKYGRKQTAEEKGE